VSDWINTLAQLLARILTERRARWEAKQLAKFAEQGKTPPKDWQNKYPEPVRPNITDLPELPEGWVWASVDQIGEVTTGFTPSTANSDYFGGGVPFFKPTDLDAGYEVIKYRDSLTALGAAQGRLLPAKSILVTCIGATIGKTGLAHVACTTNQQINAISVSEEEIAPEFIYFVMTSWLGQKQIKDNASATTLPILNKSKFERLVVPIPSLNEQVAVIERLEERLSRVEDQEMAIGLSLKQSTAQRQNILRAAFAGQLVPQDPNDEPASVLLERIRKERAAPRLASARAVGKWRLHEQDCADAAPACCRSLESRR
jgi:type I restriction enzyme S subunit